MHRKGIGSDPRSVGECSKVLNLAGALLLDIDGATVSRYPVSKFAKGQAGCCFVRCQFGQQCS